MADFEQNSQFPAHWSKENGLLHCLGCRRDLAAEAALEDTPEDMPLAERVQLKRQGRLDFEIKRDPEAQNGQIAKACGTSAASVAKARERLEIPLPPRT
jgi:hypothetical protein